MLVRSCPKNGGTSTTETDHAMDSSREKSEESAKEVMDDRNSESHVRDKPDTRRMGRLETVEANQKTHNHAISRIYKDGTSNFPKRKGLSFSIELWLTAIKILCKKNN